MFDNFFYLSPLLAMLICLGAFFRYRRFVNEYKALLVDVTRVKKEFDELVELREIEVAQFKAVMTNSLDIDEEELLNFLDDEFDLYDEPKPKSKPKSKRLPKPNPKRLPLLRR